VSKVLVTGMSGTGKSSALQVLGEKGHRVVDTDTDQWSEWVTELDGSQDWTWREEAITAQLNDRHDGHLFVSGCKTNQGSSGGRTAAGGTRGVAQSGHPISSGTYLSYSATGREWQLRPPGRSLRLGTSDNNLARIHRRS
jgi:hypothetical protein